jgi:hypothetical protein
VVAVSFADGVVVGADSRVSTGTYISNRASDKITPLADNVYLLRSGSAADTQAVADYGAPSLGWRRVGPARCRQSRWSPQMHFVRVTVLPLTGLLLQCATSQSSTRCSCSGRQACAAWQT